MLMVKLSQTPRATCTSDGNNLFRGSRMLLLKTSPIWRLSKTMASGSCLVVKETSCGSGSKSDTEIFSCCLLDSLTGVASAIALAKKPRATMNFIIFIIMSCRGFGQGFVWAEMMNVVELDQGQSCFQKKKKKKGSCEYRLYMHLMPWRQMILAGLQLSLGTASPMDRSKTKAPQFVWLHVENLRVAISLGQDGHFLFCVRSLWDSRFNDVRTCGDLCLNMIKSFRARRRRGSADKSLVC